MFFQVGSLTSHSPIAIPLLTLEAVPFTIHCLTPSGRRRLVLPHAAQAIQVTRRVRALGSRWRTVTVYAVTSLALGTARPAQLAGWLRGHWKIENRLHWVRDVTFSEDASPACTGSLPRVMASLRNLAIGALRLAGHPNLAAALRHTGRHTHEADIAPPGPRPWMKRGS